MSSLFSFLQSNHAMIAAETLRHIRIVFLSVFIGFLIAVPLGILLSRHRSAARYVLALAGAVQTIPGLVMLGFAMILFGIGTLPAVIVLVIYAILPPLQNTYTGITQVDPSYIESARGIGMNNLQILTKVELPLALASIVGGLRIATIYIINWATLAGLIGAGGLGDLIWTGLATYENKLIITGAVLAAAMALAFGGLIDGVRYLITPKGLRVGKEGAS